MKKNTIHPLFRHRPPAELSPYERGLYYETVVCRWLKKKGYKILDRNYRGQRQSEIDIVAKEGKTLVFIEVKARRKMSVFAPLRSVDARKRRALSLACTDYLRALRGQGIDPDDLDIRYDIITLAFDAGGEPVSLDHYISYLVMTRENF